RETAGTAGWLLRPCPAGKFKRFRSATTVIPGRPESQSGTTACPLRRGVREAVVLELVAQRGLQDLARGRVRDAVDEGDVVGHPPFRDLAVHELQDVLAARLLALLELNDQQRTLVPFG